MNENLQQQLLAELQHGNKQAVLKRCIDHALSSTYRSETNALVRSMADALYTNDESETVNQLVHEFASLLPSHEKEEAVALHKTVLKATDISKHYKVGAFNFKAFSLDLKAGSLTGVVGQNGNGKTTLLRMLCGDLLATTGVIDYPLLATNNLDPYAIKQHIGFISQRIPRWFGVLKDNLVFTLANLNFSADEIEFRVEVMLKRLGLYDFREHTWSQISGGYRTRFELAKVLLTKPRILVLDEPLANLDVKAQQTFLQDLRHMAKTEGHPMAVILSSQLLHEVEQVSDDLIFIKNGECLLQSTSIVNNHESNIVEFISATSYEVILKLSSTIEATLKSENNLYTISCSKNITTKQLLKAMIEADIDILYYRDITNSTKRLF